MVTEVFHDVTVIRGLLWRESWRDIASLTNVSNSTITKELDWLCNQKITDPEFRGYLSKINEVSEGIWTKEEAWFRWRALKAEHQLEEITEKIRNDGLTLCKQERKKL